MSPSQPNVSLLIDASGPGDSRSLADSLRGFLSGTKLRLVGNLADVNRLKAGDFFEALYAGDGQLLGDAIRISRVDYILMGRAAYSFRPQPNLDPNLITCDLKVTYRLVDHSGTMTQSGSV